ncbi:reverse transcriptase family protein [Chamaesiphon sp.]|uniref:reverse transcriptase family protein n=1 Tax=Chamaesiphon sp. TaxID=2814140 RepID=UPI003592F12D
MTEQPRTRQDLYDRIRQTSKDEFILDEMIRLGFWAANGEIPNDPADEIRRRGEIQRELDTLRAENRRLYDEEALKKAAVKLRMAESRRMQQETKERRERERQARAAAWSAQQEREIGYLGEGVSAGLNFTESDLDRLQQHRLPILHTAADLAIAMGITIGQLRFLAFSRRVATISHYVRFEIPKKTGGVRQISAPLPRLKQAQQWILDNILEQIVLHPAAHGFRRGRSIVTNAQRHVGAAVVINLDLENFFPSISYHRVKGIFRSLGYSEAIATILGLICTEPEVTAVELDGKTYYIAQTERHLPQGAPSSPALTNLLCRRLDRRLDRMASNRGYTYTRYADDLTFSTTDSDKLREIGNILQGTHGIVTHEGLTLHPAKTRVLRQSQQQEVTGVIVNEKLNVDRAALRRFRATLYQIEKDGLAGKQWGQGADLLQSIVGFANYVAMVNPTKGREFLAIVHRIQNKYAKRRR